MTLESDFVFDALIRLYKDDAEFKLPLVLFVRLSSSSTPEATLYDDGQLFIYSYLTT